MSDPSRFNPNQHELLRMLDELLELLAKFDMRLVLYRSLEASPIVVPVTVEEINDPVSVYDHWRDGDFPAIKTYGAVLG